MKLYMFVFLLLSACSYESHVTQPEKVVTRDLNVEELVKIENDYRVTIGQLPLTKGLSCSLYTVPNGSAGITGTTLTHQVNFTLLDTFNQPDGSVNDGLSILPSAFRSMYTSWYVVRCTGKLVVTVTDYYKFDLRSDDGSMLYIGGSLLINNDGNHAPTTKSGVKLLRQGVNDFRLDYMQGPGGSQALVLHMDNIVVKPTNFYR